MGVYAIIDLMLDENFVKKQNALFGLYYWSGFVGRSLAGLAIFISALTTPQDNVYGPVLAWTGIILLVIASTFRYFLKSTLQVQFFDGYTHLVKGTAVDLSKTFHHALVGPVVRSYSYNVELLRAVTGMYKEYPTTLQDVQITYRKDVPGKNDATFSLRYTVHAVQLPAKYPHLFIAGKSNQKKRLFDTSSLWALATKLDPSQKLQGLEGDFGKYFDVYTTHQEEGSLEFKKENDALRVLTPDVMLSLRDQGFDFDYEIFEDYLYVIHEPDLLTAAELENFIASLAAALSELIAQLAGHHFTDDGTKLNTRKSALTPDILFGPIVKPALLVLIYLVLVILGAMIGTALQ